MKRLKSHIYSVNPLITGSIMGILTVAQIVFTFFYNQPGLQALRVVGYVLWALSAVFGILPIITFRSKGGVQEGKSYMRTTVLVDSGLYAIVRHPQFLAGMLLNVACMLIAQHWLIVALGIPAMLLTYLDAFRADESLVEKFGDDYRCYMQRVPRLNFLSGIVRLLQRGDLLQKKA
jgi:protein-S-isoprenylcysteine O-methyltransferase Ste14